MAGAALLVLLLLLTPTPVSRSGPLGVGAPGAAAAVTPFAAPRPAWPASPELGRSTPPGPITYSGGRLTQNPPPARAFAGSVGLVTNGVGMDVLAGGVGSCGAFCNDTWALTFTSPTGPTWFPFGSTGDQGRRAPSLAWDAASSELVLFGGLNGTSGALNDTWTRVPYHTAWGLRPETAAPPARWAASMTYDPALGGLVLFGGVDAGGLPLGDTWVFRGDRWSPLVAGAGPTPRSGAVLLWQGPEERLVLFGGNGSAGPLGDTWALGASGWYALHPLAAPPPRDNASAVTDGEGDPTVIAGEGAGGELNDSWVLFGDNWTQILPDTTLVPPPRQGAFVAPDLGATANDFLLWWGSRANGALLTDLYAFRVWNGGTPGGSPPFLVDLAASPTAGPPPLAVTLQAFGEGGTPPYTTTWDLGDGSPASTSPFVSHVYPGPGNYTAWVRVLDSGYPPRSFNGTIPITVASPTTGPAPSFSFAPATGRAPFRTTFTPRLVGGAPPYALTWTFGDGGPPSHDPGSPSHTYNRSGSFLANLTVQDGAGTRATWSSTVRVTGPTLVVYLAATPSAGMAPLTVQFRASATGGPSPYEYLWRFGDGNGTNGGTSNSTTYTFPRSGNFTTVVTVVDARGENATAPVHVEVTAPPPPPPPPAPTVLQDVARALVTGAAFLVQPWVGLPLLLGIGLVGSYRWGLPELRRVRAVRRGLSPRPLRARWGLAEVEVMVRGLRRGRSWRWMWRRLLPLLRRDARRLALRLAWRPGPVAVWAVRRALILPAQLLIAATVFFLGLEVIPALADPRSVPPLPAGPLGLLQGWAGYVAQLVSGGFSDPRLQAYLPYSLQLMAVVAGLSLVISYPIGLLAGWYRGRALDQTTRIATTLAFAVPIFVVVLLTFGGAWRWYFDLTGGDTLEESLPTYYWFLTHMGGEPSWIGFYQNTLPTGYILVDAPLHGAWALEQLQLLKILVQGFPIAAVYAAIFLRYARLATEEASRELHIVGGRARGLGDRQLLWSHTSRKVAPLYASIFGTTFPTLLFIQMVAEWAYNDLGIGQAFLVAVGSPVVLGEVAFVLLLLVFVVNTLAEGVSRSLDPTGGARSSA